MHVVYTPWANLRKTSECAPAAAPLRRAAPRRAAPLKRRAVRSMEVGQVGFREDKAVTHCHVAKKCADTVKRLEKTRQERFPNLAAEREEYDRQARAAGGLLRGLLRGRACAHAAPLRCCAAQVRAERKAEERSRRKEELEVARERERAAEERSYDRIMGVCLAPAKCTPVPPLRCASPAPPPPQEEKMVSNREAAERYASVEEAEEDFM